MMRILGISGSLRQGSYNTALLRAAMDLVPDGMAIEAYDLAPIPLYNDDVRLQGFPAVVEDFRAKIRQADGLLFVTPEYNRSIPGVLKNAIDWASRAPDQPFDGKPVAIMGASLSALGTALANHHLRQILVYLNAQMLNGPEVLVGGATAKFDQRGHLTDEATCTVVTGHLAGLKRLVLRLKG